MQMGEEAVNSQKCDIAGFGRLFCLPSKELVRMDLSSIQGRIVQAAAKLVPLINAGPQTVWYQENLRLWASDQLA